MSETNGVFRWNTHIVFTLLGMIGGALGVALVDRNAAWHYIDQIPSIAEIVKENDHKLDVIREHQINNEGLIDLHTREIDELREKVGLDGKVPVPSAIGGPKK